MDIFKFFESSTIKIFESILFFIDLFGNFFSQSMNRIDFSFVPIFIEIFISIFTHTNRMNIYLNKSFNNDRTILFIVIYCKYLYIFLCNCFLYWGIIHINIIIISFLRCWTQSYWVVFLIIALFQRSSNSILIHCFDLKTMIPKLNPITMDRTEVIHFFVGSHPPRPIFREYIIDIFSSHILFRKRTIAIAKIALTFG